MGQNCERCKPFYYRDPQRSLEDPYVCQRKLNMLQCLNYLQHFSHFSECDCDPRGSEDTGLCDEYTDLETGMEAGKCHCKDNVEGRRCDHCKPGFWNMNDLNPAGCEGRFYWLYIMLNTIHFICYF